MNKNAHSLENTNSKGPRSGTTGRDAHWQQTTQSSDHFKNEQTGADTVVRQILHL